MFQRERACKWIALLKHPLLGHNVSESESLQIDCFIEAPPSWSQCFREREPANGLLYWSTPFLVTMFQRARACKWIALLKHPLLGHNVSESESLQMDCFIGALLDHSPAATSAFLEHLKLKFHNFHLGRILHLYSKVRVTSPYEQSFVLWVENGFPLKKNTLFFGYSNCENDSI